jgi:hypothetical protein
LDPVLSKESKIEQKTSKLQKNVEMGGLCPLEIFNFEIISVSKSKFNAEFESGIRFVPR